MTSTKINLLLLPLLLAILLSTATKLRIGKALDSFFYTILIPIHSPIGYIRQFTDKQFSFIKKLPSLNNENISLKSKYAQVLSENELLKQSLADSNTLIPRSDFKSILPVRVTGAIGNNTVSSTLSLEEVKVNQPLVSGKIFLGTVAKVKGSVITINPLNSDRSISFPVHTSSGIKGQFKFSDNTPQISDIPNLSPITVDDYVFTEPGELIPGNLVVGKIKKIISGSQEPLQKAEIILEASLSDSLENLIIVLEQ